MVEKILEEKQINIDFLKEYNRAVVISEKVDKKEEGGPIKIPEYVKKFKEEYNIIKIKSERPPKKEEKEPIELPDYIKRFREEYRFIRRRR